MNNAFGSAENLPFDILQHRWPIEYRLTEFTQVRDQRYATLSETLAVALTDCAHTLDRAAAMAEALDTSCFDFIAHNEQLEFMEMHLPATTMGQLLMGLDHNLAVRRLIELGALCVVSTPHIGYSWTYDGRAMIQHLNAVHPQVLEVLRQHKISPQAI